MIMTKRNPDSRLDDGATFVGILIGIIVGGVYALLHVKQRGKTTRKDLTQFGAGSLEIDLDSSLVEAKQKARQRQEDNH